MASVCVHCEARLIKTFDKAGMRSHNMNTHPKYKVECATCWNAFENECSNVQHFNEKHSVSGRHKRVRRHKLDKKKRNTPTIEAVTVDERGNKWLKMFWFCCGIIKQKEKNEWVFC